MIKYDIPRPSKGVASFQSVRDGKEALKLYTTKEDSGTLPSTIMAKWKMVVSPRLVSLKLGQFSTEP